MSAEAPAVDTWGTTEDFSKEGGEGFGFGDEQQLVSMDLPEVKLFNKWQLNDIEISDISLVV